jgi:Flp pilus assembly pilin Flp
MKNMMKNLVRDEKGAALILALLVLLIGGLISAALLNHMGSGILAGEVHERRTAELYAADAGVEDAIWKIQHGETPVCPGDPYWSYNITDVNGKKLQISIEYMPDEGTYKIISIALTDGDGDSGVAAIDSSTAIESYVSILYLDFSSLLDHAIVSYDTIDIQPGNIVDGDVWLPDEGNLEIHDPSDITGEVKDEEDVELIWPTAEQLSSYYYEQVEGTYDPGLSVDIEYIKVIGPCYRDGDLVVDNTGDPDTLIMEGTVYVAGDLEFWQAGSHDYTVDLNGHTIFAEGGIDFPSNVVGISGPGCIIAVGDINFQPSIAGDDFVLVMSITGRTDFHPSGDFTGCVAGNTEVQLQPGCTINWINPEGKGLNFPMGAGGAEEPPPINVVKIESWEIIHQ